MYRERGHTGKLLAKNNKFSNDMKPPPLQNIEISTISKAIKKGKKTDRNDIEMTKEILLNLPKIC